MKFEKALEEVMESLDRELIEEGKYAKWFDQAGKKVYPGKLTMKEMKKVLKKRLGFFQKNGRVFALPLKPSKGKIQKEFLKEFKRSFMVNSNK